MQNRFIGEFRREKKAKPPSGGGERQGIKFF